MQDVQLNLERGRAPITDTDVWEAAFSANRWLTRAELAGLVGRKPTPSFIARLEAMAARGWLQRGVTTLPNGAKRYSYMALEG